MSLHTFSIFANILGVVVDAISLSAFLIKLFQFHLPSNRIKELEILMKETEEFFAQAVQEGCLSEPGFVQQTEGQLTRMREETWRLQYGVYNIATIRQDCLEWLKGTSGTIGSMCRSLKKLKAQIIARQRVFDVASHCSLKRPVPQHISLSPPPPLFADRKYLLSQPLGAQIRRPHSCPPIFSRWRLGDTEPVFVQEDPFCNPTQNDPEVRITDSQTCETITHTSVMLEPGA